MDGRCSSVLRLVFQSPGRINLIGEHTDYNGGYVFPAAIDRYTYLTFEHSDRFRAYAVHFGQRVEFSLDEDKSEEEWVNYVKGAVFYTAHISGKKIGPFTIEIDGNLPLGAGLSSSASLLVGVIYGISVVENLGLSRMEIARLAHEVESKFVGVNCGMMDQLAVAMGKKDTFMLIDTSSEMIEYIDAEHFPVVTVIDSGVRHKLLSGGYNDRRSECKEAERIVGSPFREMDLEVVEEKRSRLGEVLYKRARHVVEENVRVLRAVDAVRRCDWNELGMLLYASHESLRTLFEVSTPEIDYIVDALKGIKGVYGARIMGGGFGGSVLVVSRNPLNEELRWLKREYSERFGIQLHGYPVRISDGVKEFKQVE